MIKAPILRREDQKVIADTLFAWARERGAIDFSHWFFPLRGYLPGGFQRVQVYP